MKIATRIIAGYGVLMILLAGLVIHQVITLHRMQASIDAIARGNIQAVLASVQLLRDRDLVEEYAKKALVVGDPAYKEQLRLYADNFAAGLSDLRGKPRSPREQTELQRLAGFWNVFQESLSREQASGTGGAAEFPQELQDELDSLRTQALTVYETLVQSIAAQAEQSLRTGERAEMLSWFAAAAALILSTLVSLLIVRSISVPLRQLTEGTRAIAAGKFYFRLDTSGKDEFAQVARDFNTMTHRLGELDVMKKAFVSHVSHELKAPLASMRETTQLLIEEIPGPLNDKQRRLLELNLQSSRRLSSIIGNLLDMSKMEAGIMEYDLKRQPLAPLIRTAVAEYAPQAAEKQIPIQQEFPQDEIIVECDTDRIIQVVGNILGNAIKFSPKHGTIVVRLCQVSGIPSGVPPRWREVVADHSPRIGFAQIAVADSGPGIPDPHKETVFERFHQATPGRKVAGQGVGLGLAISQTVMQAHRGAVWVEDNPAGGSIFYILLRMAAEAEQSIVTAI